MEASGLRDPQKQAGQPGPPTPSVLASEPYGSQGVCFSVPRLLSGVLGIYIYRYRYVDMDIDTDIDYRYGFSYPSPFSGIRVLLVLASRLL